MYTFIKFLHLAAAIVWLGGMTLILWALRPALHGLLQPPQRLPLLAQVLQRFFVLVWIAIAILLAGGFHMFFSAGAQAAPIGWHVMTGLGVLMCLVFAHIYFAPFRRLRRAVQATDWPAGGKAAGQIATLVMVNFGLGWLAVAAVSLLK